MKILRVTIKNIGMIADETIEFNKPLLLFYGEIRQGKSTILNALKFAFGGAFPQDIIRHGEKEASVSIELDGGLIGRSWYVAKDGKTTKARDVTFVRAGKPVSNPVNEIKRLLNPFLLDQDHLRNMTETERKKYFAELFAVDTTALDTELFNNQTKASNLRSKLDGYGDIDLTPVDRVDAEALKTSLQKIRDSHKEACDKVEFSNMKVSAHNTERAGYLGRQVDITDTIDRLKNELAQANSALITVLDWLKNNPDMTLKVKPSAPDTAEIEGKISQAAANDVLYQQWEKNKDRQKQKDEDQAALATLETRARAIKKEKVAKLKEISDSCKIPGLTFSEDGSFSYEDTDAGMLSTSQIMKLSSELSAMYPKELGLELLDRAESLGKSIFTFVEKAKRDETTILATIVGEKPAQVPEDIGVFVVEQGKIKK